MSKLYLTSVKMWLSFEQFVAISRKGIKRNALKIGTAVCEDHGVCFCDLCIGDYTAAGFTNFNNRCVHFEAQCINSSESEIYINQMEFLYRYFDHLHSYQEQRQDEVSANTLNLVY